MTRSYMIELDCANPYVAETFTSQFNKKCAGDSLNMAAGFIQISLSLL